MANFEIDIASPVSAAYTTTGPVVTNCETEQVITVNHNGTDKHVYIQSSTNAVPYTAVNETITANKTYTLSLNGNNATSQSVTTSITMIIRDLTATGTILANITLTRKDSGNQC